MFQCLVFGPKWSPGWRLIVFFQKRSRLTSTFVYKVDSTHSINISIGVMWWFEKKYSNMRLTKDCLTTFTLKECFPQVFFSAVIFVCRYFVLAVIFFAGIFFGSDFFRRTLFLAGIFSQVIFCRYFVGRDIFGRDSACQSPKQLLTANHNQYQETSEAGWHWRRPWNWMLVRILILHQNDENKRSSW